MQRVTILAALGLLAAATGFAPPSVATTLTISPLRVELTEDRSTAVVELRNLGATGTLVQVEAFAWTDAEVTEGLPPTDELLAVPPVFELAPGATQLIRLGLRRPATGSVGKAYRLVLAEVPSAVEVPGGGIAFVLRYNLPVYVTPAGAEPAPAWTAIAAPDGRGELWLVNAGAAHLTLRDLRVVDPESQRVLLQASEPGAVLAGGERRWRLDGGSGRLPRKVTITAVTDGGELKVTVPVEGD